MSLSPLHLAQNHARSLPAGEHITLTQAAATHIQAMLAGEPSALGLRVGVKKSGCTGYGYVMDFARSIEADDLVFEQYHVCLVCDKESLSILKGSRLDFVVHGLSRLLQFNNPNVVDSCGCGESFSIKETPAHA